MSSTENLNKVIVALKDIESDSTVPKNVKAKITSIIKILEDKGEISIKVSKVLNEIEQISEDVNIPSFTRTQLFQISSMLEVV